MRTRTRSVISLAWFATLMIVPVLHAAGPPQPADAPDWEAALADYRQSSNLYRNFRRWSIRHDPSPEAKRARWQHLAKQFPHSRVARDFAEWQVRQALKNERWDEMLRLSKQQMQRFPAYDNHHTMLRLARLTHEEKVPGKVRLEAVRTLIPFAKGYGFALKMVHNNLNPMSITTPRQSYELYRKGIERFGDDARLRPYMWDMLQPYTRAEKDLDKLAPALEWFIDFYGTDNPAGETARRILLSRRAEAGDDQAQAKLDKLQAAAKQRDEAITAAFDSASQQIKAGHIDAAIETLKRITDAHPAAFAGGQWNALMQGPVSNLNVDARIRFLHLIASIGPVSDVTERAVKGVWRSRAVSLEQHPDAPRVLMAYVRRCSYDVGRSLSKADVLRDLPQLERDPALRLEAFQVSAEVAREVGATKDRVKLLFEVGRKGWDLKPDAARRALREAASHYPDIPQAAEAGWMLSLLEGDTRVVQGPRPREPRGFSAERVEPVTPPEAPAATAMVRETDGKLALRAYETKRNVAAGRQPLTHGDAPKAARATDGDPDTAWRAPDTPAELIVPLARDTTVRRITLHTLEPSYVTVALLDRKGRVLSRYERDWGLWAFYRTKKLWPSQRITLDLLPVGGVRYVRVRVHRALGDVAGIRELAVHPAPHAAKGQRVIAEHDVPADRASARIAWQANEPRQQMTYQRNTESVGFFPLIRWRDPWPRYGNPKPLKNPVGNTGMHFFGTNAKIVLSGEGALDWQLAGQSGSIDHPAGDKSEHPLVSSMSAGAHLLRLHNRALPAHDDKWGANKVEFHKLVVDGRSRVSLHVRFGSESDGWGAWRGPLDDAQGTHIAVPSEEGARPKRMQVRAVFDSRAVRAQQSAVLENVDVSFPDETDASLAQLAPISEPAPALRPEPGVVTELLQQRRVVVTYPKVGTKAEYRAARRIADKADVYLVSDDHGLNNYDGLVLSVGTPLRHRYARQLIARRGVWHDRAFLNDTDGVIGVARDVDGEPQRLYVTGDTPERVVRAAERLLQRLPKHAQADAPFRVFQSNTLERIYPWQLRPNRDAPEQLDLRLARGDRRSTQFGIAAEHELGELNVTVSALRSEGGETIPQPTVRHIGFYEWIPFFGDLRLPNALVPEPRLPIPANTSHGVWLTVRTPKDAAPGVYTGEVRIESGAHSQAVPVRVRVEPITLPRYGRHALYSFAGVPYWFHRGSDAFKQARRNTARNEAKLGVTWLSPRWPVQFDYAPSALPRRAAVVKDQAKPGESDWAGFGRRRELKPGETLHIAFDAPLKPASMAVTVKTSAPAPITLEARTDDGAWRPVGEQTPALADKARALLFENINYKAGRWRVRATGDKPVTVELVRAFTGSDQRWPFTVDFSAFERELSAWESVYEKRGLPAPTFYRHSHDLRQVNAALFEEEGHYPPTVARIFSEQFKRFLERTGRDDRFIVKVGDEPGNIKRWTRWAKPYRAAGLQTSTHHSGNYDNIDILSGVMEPWTPNYQHDVLRDFFDKRRAAGDEVHWYICGVPATRLTGSLHDNLPFYWLTAKWRFDGAHSYAAMHASDYSMPVPFRYEHGMNHRILYLPDGTVLDTMRRVLEGEGIQDLKLLEYVRQRIAALRASGDAAAADALSKRRQAIMESVVPYRYGYASTPSAWLEARGKLYDLALEARRQTD